MFNRKNSNRKMKKIFQWEEYLNWKNLSKEQKLDFSMGRIFKLEKYVKGTKIKFQEGVLIPISRLYSLCFS